MTTIANVIDRKLRDRVEADSETGCHTWQAHIGSNGYGYFYLNGREQLAHRVAYALYVGDIPEGFDVDHLCRNKRCVNPDHLEAVTHAENVRRWQEFEFSKGCARGHDDWVSRPNGRRFCRVCHNDGQRRRYEKRGRR